MRPGMSPADVLGHRQLPACMSCEYRCITGICWSFQHASDHLQHQMVIWAASRDLLSILLHSRWMSSLTVNALYRGALPASSRRIAYDSLPAFKALQTSMQHGMILELQSSCYIKLQTLHFHISAAVLMHPLPSDHDKMTESRG